MPDPLPRLSIITACLNRGGFLRKALDSVLAQDVSCWEHIIVDGGSTDGTLDLLKEYPRLRVVSEPDAGMYYAWNKGLSLATGDVIAFLNSDDYYEPGILGAVLSRFATDPSLEAVIGGADFLREDRPGIWKTIWVYPAIPTGQIWERLTLGSPVTNAWFIRRSVYQRVGNYDTAFHWASDREFLLRAALAGVKYQPLEQIIYHYRLHGGSITMDPRAEQVVRVWDETLGICENFLEDPSMPDDKYQVLKTWHARLSSEIALLLLRRGRLGETRRMMDRGRCVNSDWINQFLTILGEKFARLPQRIFK